MNEQQKQTALKLPSEIKELMIELTDLKYELAYAKEQLIQKEILVDENLRLELSASGIKVTEKLIENGVLKHQGIIDIKISIMDIKKKIGYTEAELQSSFITKELITTLFLGVDHE